MKNKTTHFVFFSPTGTTQTTILTVGKGTGCKIGTILDLTKEAPQKTPTFTEADLVVVGMPVYGSRLPSLAVERFKSLQGTNTPIVPIVVYGNCHYGDALAELFDLCSEQGFRPVAAGAFLGEHSFSTADLPLSPGRPDAADKKQAETFGIQIGQLPATARLEPVQVPGNRPYKPAPQLTGSATSVDSAACTKCGKCIEACPTQGMHMTSTAAEADPDNCIWCMACERICPSNARSLTHEKVMASAQKLHDHFSARRDPESFLAAN